MTTQTTPSAAPRWAIMAAFAAIYLIWGSTYLGIRFAIETLPPFFMAGTRFVVAGLILFAVLRWRGVPLPRRIHWRSTLIIGTLLLLGGNGGVTWSEQRIPSGLAALLVALVPLWMIVLDWLRPGGVARPGGKTFIGLALGLAGMVLLIGPGELGDGRPLDMLGVVVVLGATLSWASGSLYSRHAPLPDNPLMSTALEMLLGGGVLLLAALLTGEGAQINLNAVSARSLLALAYLIVFGSLVAFSAYVWLLKVSVPARVSTYAFVNPMVAVFLGWALAGEALSWSMLLAAGVIVSGVVLITLQRIRETQEITRLKPRRRWRRSSDTQEIYRAAR